MRSLKFCIKLLPLILVVSCTNTNLYPIKVANMEIGYTTEGKIDHISLINDTLSNVQEEIAFYPNGNIESIKKNIDSLNKEQRIWFYPNGGIFDMAFYKNGKANGNAFVFYGDGAIKSHKYLRDDKLVGHSTSYYQDSIGTLKKIFLYDDNGKLVSVQTATPRSLGISVTP